MTDLTARPAKATPPSDRLASETGRLASETTQTLRVFGPSCGSKVTRVGALASLWVHGVAPEDTLTRHHRFPVPRVGAPARCTAGSPRFALPLTLAR
jgi:hypothetical protein